MFIEKDFNNTCNSIFILLLFGVLVLCNIELSETVFHLLSKCLLILFFYLYLITLIVNAYLFIRHEMCKEYFEMFIEPVQKGERIFALAFVSMCTLLIVCFILGGPLTYLTYVHHETLGEI